jgi:hypothetical protein
MQHSRAVERLPNVSRGNCLTKIVTVREITLIEIPHTSEALREHIEKRHSPLLEYFET